MPALHVIDLGLIDYAAAHQRQLHLVSARKEEAARDTLLLLEHPHVFTLGRRRTAAANVLTPGDVPVLSIERGGDVTYHGPGQLVAYPIVALGEGERDLHRFLRNLEEGVIATCARYGVAAGRESGKTGVWTGGKKLASIGIACRRWVTFHGLALNVNTDLSYFARINPCGFDAGVMTSLAAETRSALDLDEVKRALAHDLAAALDRELAPSVLESR